MNITIFWYAIVLFFAIIFIQSVESSGRGTSDNKKENDGKDDHKNDQHRRQRRVREHEAKKLAKIILRAAADENCDWKVNIFPRIKGEICGAHYKVLDIDRKNNKLNKSDIKKAYRQQSLLVHPDKNISPEATEAFKVVQEAYECLSDDSCRREYDGRLNSIEVQIATRRREIKDEITTITRVTLLQGYFYVSLAAANMVKYGMKVWEKVGEFEVDIFGSYYKVGQFGLLGFLVLTPGRVILKIEALAYAIVWLNEQLYRRYGRAENEF